MLERRTAYYIKEVQGFNGCARLYRLDPPMGGLLYQHEYVVVSATDMAHINSFVMNKALHQPPETFIFPATPEGEIENFSELDGSYRGGLDHEQALANAGYELVKGGGEHE